VPSTSKDMFKPVLYYCTVIIITVLLRVTCWRYWQGNGLVIHRLRVQLMA